MVEIPHFTRFGFEKAESETEREDNKQENEHVVVNRKRI